MGCSTIGPPLRAVSWWVKLHMCRRGVLQMTTDDRRQRASLVWPSYTMCRWASNKWCKLISKTFVNAIIWNVLTPVNVDKNSTQNVRVHFKNNATYRVTSANCAQKRMKYWRLCPSIGPNTFIIHAEFQSSVWIKVDRNKLYINNIIGVFYVSPHCLTIKCWANKQKH